MRIYIVGFAVTGLRMHGEVLCRFLLAAAVSLCSVLTNGAARTRRGSAKRSKLIWHTSSFDVHGATFYRCRNNIFAILQRTIDSASQSLLARHLARTKFVTDSCERARGRG